MSAWKVGDRVRVAIRHPKEYAHGAFKALNGKVGAVEEIKTTRENRCLVRFDTPAERWWAYQIPASSYWFLFSELQAEVST